jgi:hypothetical protein
VAWIARQNACRNRKCPSIISRKCHICDSCIVLGGLVLVASRSISIRYCNEPSQSVSLSYVTLSELHIPPAPDGSRYAHRLIALAQIPRLFSRTPIISRYSWSPMSARIATSFRPLPPTSGRGSSTSPTDRLRNYAADSFHKLLASRKRCLQRQISKPLYQPHIASYRTPRN